MSVFAPALVNYQTDNANSISSTNGAKVILQMGWGQVAGNAAATLTNTVTFPTAFTTVLGVTVGLLGAHASSTAATDITNFDTNYSGGTVAITGNAFTITTSNFLMTLTRSTGSFASTLFWGYSWIAWGI